jgi:biopolymer transport protein ExbB
MFDLLQRCCMFMYFILAVSVLALAIFCERASFLFIRLKLNTDHTLPKILFFIEKVNYHGAIEESILIEKYSLGRISKAGLFKTINHVIKTAAMAGYPNFQVAVLKK